MRTFTSIYRLMALVEIPKFPMKPCKPRIGSGFSM